MNILAMKERGGILHLLPKSARDHRDAQSHVPHKEVAHNTHATF
jgi:hypothetical protein